MYTPKKFEHLVGMEGFSESLLRNHFSLYEGYVKNTNLLIEKLNTLTSGESLMIPEYHELKRRFGWEYNGMRLHELYFGNLVPQGHALSGASTLGVKIATQWGSIDAWAKDFRATGALRGIGWAMLVRDNETGDLFNVWVNEHDGGHLAGATPLLVMDVFEHAFILDYGINRAQYIDAFWKNIDWTVVISRFDA